MSCTAPLSLEIESSGLPCSFLGLERAGQLLEERALSGVGADFY